MGEFTTKVKDQYETGVESFEKLITAGKGLAVRVRENSSKQFNELVKAGEKTEGASKGLVKQVRDSIEEQLTDAKAAAKKVRLASLGLLTQIKDNSEHYYNELVKLGDTDTELTEEDTKEAEVQAA
ncbi:MAG: hypothetical protein JKY67_05570 [Pseudomonadales bacterium]|nr:hypothetical protein [Pseudomonadales bacterium]